MGVVFPLAAIRHAANAVEATLGIGAVVIVVGWPRFAAGTDTRSTPRSARVSGSSTTPRDRCAARSCGSRCSCGSFSVWNVPSPRCGGMAASRYTTARSPPSPSACCGFRLRSSCSRWSGASAFVQLRGASSTGWTHAPGRVSAVPSQDPLTTRCQANAEHVRRVGRGHVTRRGRDDRQSFTQRKRDELPVGRVSRVDAVPRTTRP
jgi:hypothetical protein